LGLKSVKNGQLLALIERAQFDAFITNDKKMEAEGQLSCRPFAILILSATNWNVIKPNVDTYLLRRFWGISLRSPYLPSPYLPLIRFMNSILA
jgi:hypothetical protein